MSSTASRSITNQRSAGPTGFRQQASFARENVRVRVVHRMREAVDDEARLVLRRLRHRMQARVAVGTAHHHAVVRPVAAPTWSISDSTIASTIACSTPATSTQPQRSQRDPELRTAAPRGRGATRHVQQVDADEEHDGGQRRTGSAAIASVANSSTAATTAAIVRCATWLWPPAESTICVFVGLPLTTNVPVNAAPAFASASPSMSSFSLNGSLYFQA